MTPYRFERLCADLCELAGVPAPALAPDEHGVTAFTFESEGVPTSIVHVPALGEAIIVAGRLGKVDEADELRACRGFLEANFLSIGQPAAPCVGRDPTTGDFVLSYSRPLDAMTAPDLYQAIMRMTEASRDWHRRLAQPRSPLAR